MRITLDIWYDHASRAIVFSSDDKDLGPKGMIGSFIKGSAAETRARELLALHGKLPAVYLGHLRTLGMHHATSNRSLLHPLHLAAGPELFWVIVDARQPPHARS